MPKNTSPLLNENSRGSRLWSLLKRAAASKWFERTLFVAGSLVIFSSEQILTPNLEAARDDVAFVEKNLDQIQVLISSHQRALVEYNRAVIARPQVRELVAQNAFELFTVTDQLLSELRAVVEQNGRGEVFSIINAKNERRAAATQELLARNAEALVGRVNDIMAVTSARATSS
jgi:hypothetical protein